jgi:hypothetical protein
LCQLVKPKLLFRKGVQNCGRGETQAPEFTHGVSDWSDGKGRLNEIKTAAYPVCSLFQLMLCVSSQTFVICASLLTCDGKWRVGNAAHQQVNATKIQPIHLTDIAPEYAPVRTIQPERLAGYRVDLNHCLVLKARRRKTDSLSPRAGADIERGQLRFTAYMLVWRSLVAGGAALPVMSTPFLWLVESLLV